MKGKPILEEIQYYEIFKEKYYYYLFGEQISSLNSKLLYFPIKGEANYFKSINEISPCYYRSQSYRLKSSKDFIPEMLDNYLHFSLNQINYYIGSDFDNYIIFSMGLVVIINYFCVSNIQKSKSEYNNAVTNSYKMDFLLHKFLITEFHRKDFLENELRIIDKNIVKSGMKNLIKNELCIVESFIEKLITEKRERIKLPEKRSPNYMSLRNELQTVRLSRSNLPTDRLLMEKSIRDKLYKFKLYKLKFETDNLVVKVINSKKFRLKQLRLKQLRLERFLILTKSYRY